MLDTIYDIFSWKASRKAQVRAQGEKREILAYACLGNSFLKERGRRAKNNQLLEKLALEYPVLKGLWLKKVYFQDPYT